MKAVIFEKYGSPEVLEVKEIKKPRPGEHEVLIKVLAASVDATDPIVRSGQPYIARAGNGFRKPKHTVLGAALAGVIEAVGKHVTQFKVGDEVFGATGTSQGAHAEYICQSEDAVLVRKPGNMTFEEAAAVPYGILTALPFLRDQAHIHQGQHILIIGASGSIGTYAIQLAHYFGAQVTGVCSTANIDLVKALGAHKVIDYTQEDFRQNEQSYDVIFDTVGKSSFKFCKDSLKPGGVYLLTVPTLAIIRQMLWTSVIGGKKAKFATTGLRSTHVRKKDLLLTKQLIEKEELRAVIDRCYSIEQIAEAHRYVATGHKRGNVVITMNT